MSPFFSTFENCADFTSFLLWILPVLECDAFLFVQVHLFQKDLRLLSSKFLVTTVTRQSARIDSYNLIALV